MIAPGRSGSAEDSVDGDFDHNPIRVLPDRPVSSLVARHGMGHPSRVPADAALSLQSEPPGSVHLAHRDPGVPLEVADFLRPVGRDDTNQAAGGIKRERNGDDMGRSVGTQGRQGGQPPLAEKVDFGWGEVGRPAGHDGETIGSRRAM